MLLNTSPITLGHFSLFTNLGGSQSHNMTARDGIQIQNGKEVTKILLSLLITTKATKQKQPKKGTENEVQNIMCPDHVRYIPVHRNFDPS